ncbi:MAG: hypothetical protein FWB86_10640 [Treponema sp.]|nr:hypothetical protein [Treponema sp.]MCL2251913.1 hypothetical protein [Treponema sp.]
MINVEAELSKYKSCKDRDELGRVIRDYKGKALQCSGDIVSAGQYNLVALKLQEIYDSLPAPKLRNPAARTPGAPTRTATTTSDEQAKIRADWQKRTGKGKGGKK